MSCDLSSDLVLGALLLSWLCAGAAAMFDSDLNAHWELWKATHKKTYQSEVGRWRAPAHG